jgi:acetoacetyl-CoA synthetase
LAHTIDWDDLRETSSTASPPVPVPFDHPLWIVYTSGTTGPPKAIVHSHGGILLEHLKLLSLHLDIGEDDRFFWYTTTGWVMWNILVGGLLVGSSIVLYDGDPGYPDLLNLWRLGADTKATYFGVSAPFLHASLKAGLRPQESVDTSHIRGIGSTGAPLSPEGYDWVYRHVTGTALLGSMSGGTDVATAFIGMTPMLPVFPGEIQTSMLGVNAEVFDETGQPVTEQVGELVITTPMPSMPIGFWADPNDERYVRSYFSKFNHVWTHGDWAKITDRGTWIVYGRSDATLNRGGLRSGTAEYYRVVEEDDRVADSLVIHLVQDVGGDSLLLLIQVAGDISIGPELEDQLCALIRRNISPRHVPDRIIRVRELPKTLNGKKLEVPIKRLFQGVPSEDAVDIASLANPEAFLELALLAGELQV